MASEYQFVVKADGEVWDGIRHGDVFIPVGGPGWEAYQEWLAAGNKPDPVPEQPEHFPALSRRQFFQISADKGLISQNEALAAVQHGAIPQLIEHFIEEHLAEPSAQFAARMLFSGASEFDRNHPMVDQIAKTVGLNTQQLDEIWRLGAAL